MNVPWTIDEVQLSRLVRCKPYVIGRNRVLRVPSECHAEVGDSYYWYEDDDGNFLLLRDKSE